MVEKLMSDFLRDIKVSENTCPINIDENVDILKQVLIIKKIQYRIITYARSMFLSINEKLIKGLRIRKMSDGDIRYTLFQLSNK